jgi:predicted membrane-bound mannosyltransferase
MLAVAAALTCVAVAAFSGPAVAALCGLAEQPSTAPSVVSNASPAMMFRRIGCSPRAVLH